MKSPEEKRRH